MFYKYDPDNSIHVPAPFGRIITPIFMGDDEVGKNEAFSVHMTEWEPGCCVDNHSHADSTEAMYCIEGSGIAMVNNVEYEFKPGSMIVAPKNIPHQITNTGDTLLRVLCIFSPPNTAAGLKQRAMDTIAEANRLAEQQK